MTSTVFHSVSAAPVIGKEFYLSSPLLLQVMGEDIVPEKIRDEVQRLMTMKINVYSVLTAYQAFF